MIRSKMRMGILWAIVAMALHLLPGAVKPAHGQGSRKDDIVFNAREMPLAGATVRVCTNHPDIGSVIQKMSRKGMP